jgi:hypothetical protein
LLSLCASTFCLDAKSGKKIKAPEKWLKISRAAFRRRTRFKDAINLSLTRARTTPAQFFAAQKRRRAGKFF